MIHARVDIGDRIVPVKAETWKELQELIKAVQSGRKKTAKTIVTQSGEQEETDFSREAAEQKNRKA